MKTLFVYYSLEGNCRELAEYMAAEIGGSVAELRLAGGDLPQNFFKRYYQGGKGSLLKETPELLPLSVDIADFDLIVIGTPVWFWSMTPAVRSFLSSAELRDKKVALFAMYRGAAGVALSAMSGLVQQRGGTVVARAGFTDLRVRKAEKTKARALEWVRGLPYRE